MVSQKNVVFLFDVDNTFVDNDRIIDDLKGGYGETIVIVFAIQGIVDFSISISLLLPAEPCARSLALEHFKSLFTR